SMQSEVTTYLMGQAAIRNCDIVVFGKVDVGRGVEFMSWNYDRGTGLFQPEDSTVTQHDINFLLGQVSSGRNQLFAGVPVGMGERFGIDYDDDDMYNKDETRVGTNPYTIDFDHDGFRDGHEFHNPQGDPLHASGVPQDTHPPTITRTEGRFASGRSAR